MLCLDSYDIVVGYDSLLRTQVAGSGSGVSSRELTPSLPDLAEFKGRTITMRKPVDYLVDRIFPTNEIHIIAGASGVGKTTWAFQMINDWRKGIPVFDHASYPVPFVYVSCDRSRQSVDITVERVGVEPMPYVDARGVAGRPDGFAAVLEAARSIVPDVRFLFIEAISLLVPGNNIHQAYRNTADWLSTTSQALEKEDVTILGTAHSPKQRANDQILDPRQLILGTVAWAAFAETIIAIQRLAPKSADDQRRTVMVLPRNSREEMFQYGLDDNGRFVKQELETVETVMDMLVSQLPFDQDIYIADLREIADKAQIEGEPALRRWIVRAKEKRIIYSIGYGVYRRCRTV